MPFIIQTVHKSPPPEQHFLKSPQRDITATNASIAAGDICIVSDTNGVLFQGEYKPEISATEIEDKIDLIDTNIDLLVVEQQRVNQFVPLPDPVETKSRVYL